MGDVRLSDTTNLEECEAIVYAEKYGNSWNVKRATPWRNINRPSTALLSQIEIVTIKDQSDKPDTRLCAGKNVNPDKPPTVHRKFQLCFQYSTSEPEILMVNFRDPRQLDLTELNQFIRNPSKRDWPDDFPRSRGTIQKTDWFVLDQHNGVLAAIRELGWGDYSVEFRQGAKIVETYKFLTAP